MDHMMHLFSCLNNVWGTHLSGSCVWYYTSTGWPISWLFLMVGHKMVMIGHMLVMVGQMPTQAHPWLCQWGKVCFALDIGHPLKP